VQQAIVLSGGMDHLTARPAATRRARRIVLVSLAILGVASAALFGHRPLMASAPASTWADVVPSTTAGGELGELGVDDGAIPDGAAVSVFDTQLPAVVRLEPALLDALRRAATDAQVDGVGFRVNSGWRSPAHQQQLLQDAIIEHGSLDAAARWVSTPERSAHVSGGAVDIGPFAAAAWLSARGAAYGLCQIYANEPWHFELRPEAVAGRCPPMFADPTEDPRTQP
jgi:hypothetical protein